MNLDRSTSSRTSGCTDQPTAVPDFPLKFPPRLKSRVNLVRNTNLKTILLNNYKFNYFKTKNTKGLNIKLNTLQLKIDSLNCISSLISRPL